MLPHLTQLLIIQLALFFENGVGYRPANIVWIAGYLLFAGRWAPAAASSAGKLAGDFHHHDAMGGGKAAVGVDDFGNQQADILQTVNIQIARVDGANNLQQPLNMAG